jgi:hypothetical protein
MVYIPFVSSDDLYQPALCKADQDQIYIVSFKIHQVISDLDANTVDSDQTEPETALSDCFGLEIVWSKASAVDL